MQRAAVERSGSSTPITDAVYGRKGARKAKKRSPKRPIEPQHTFRVSLSPETVTALEALKAQLETTKEEARRRS